MRTTPAAATALLLAALALTACGGGGDDSDVNGGDQDAKTSAPTACAADALKIEFGPGNPAPAAGDTGNIPVTLTNEGAPCVLEGVPASEVLRGDRSWPVAPDTTAGKGGKVNLAKDEAATFTLTYVRGAAGDEKKGVRPDEVTFKLTSDGETQSYDWPDEEIAVKSDGELDINVGPVLPSGD